jgi:hypothetical protein
MRGFALHYPLNLNKKVELYLMSDIKTNKLIPVYNYNAFHVSIVTNIKTHALEPCRDNSPTMDYLTFEEIEYVNAQSNAIKNGFIRFSSEQEKEIYEALNISDWDRILTNENIKEYLLNPSKDGLQRILDVRDEITFERVRCILTNLINSGDYDISNRVINLVQLRHTEFRKNISKTQITLRDKDGESKKASTEDVEALKEQNKSLEDKIEQMQKMMEQMMEIQKANVKPEEKKELESKKVGRPSTK